MFEGCTRALTRPLGMNAYDMPFSGARRAMWIWCLEGHSEGGLERISFEEVNPECLVLAGGEANVVGLREAYAQRMDISKYLWTRGQCSLPHPGELLHDAETLIIDVRHEDVVDEKLQFSGALPHPTDLIDTKVNITFYRVCGFRMGPAYWQREG